MGEREEVKRKGRGEEGRTGKRKASPEGSYCPGEALEFGLGIGPVLVETGVFGVVG